MSRRDRAIEHLQPYIEKARAFSGWNFDDLAVTRVEQSPFPSGRNVPWDYVGLAREYAASAGRVIDFGTGGGEIYARIIEGIGAECLASEEWHVNVPVAHDRLRPLGVEVIRGQSERPAFRDGVFGLVLSRHEAIDPVEVARILRRGGVCLTQQVANEQWQEFGEVFPNKSHWPDHLAIYREQFEAAGCTVTWQHQTWQAAYATIGEVAFMLMVAPWEVPGFDPIRDVDALLALEDAHGDERGIVLTLGRYLMEARKP